MNILGKNDTDFHLDILNLVQRSTVRDLEIVLTNLWLRVLYDNKKITSRREKVTHSAEIAQAFVFDPNGSFKGFPDAAAADAWLRAEALVMMRGRNSGEFVVARPVHALATRVRNPKRTDDYGTSDVAYGWLHAADNGVLPLLKDYLDVKRDDTEQDLTTHALALLGDAFPSELFGSFDPEPAPQPICGRLGASYAEDMLRLLAYRYTMPRIALIEHMARLTGLYVGLYLLTDFAAVRSLERSGGASACGGCGTTRSSSCAFEPQIFVDCSERSRTTTALLAEDSWRLQENGLLTYLESHIRLKKFHEYAERNNRSEYRTRIPVDTLTDLAIAAGDPQHRPDLESWALDRLQEIEDRARDDATELAKFNELRTSLDRSGDGFDTYVGVIAHVWTKGWHNRYLSALDYVFAGEKNRTGLLRQPQGGRTRRRRAVLGSQLVETLGLVLLLRRDGDHFTPEPKRVDEFVDIIASRYGLLIDRLPGGVTADPATATTLSTNLTRFKLRLREAGLYRDLSDAYLAQIVAPRYEKLEKR